MPLRWALLTLNPCCPSAPMGRLFAISLMISCTTYLRGHGRAQAQARAQGCAGGRDATAHLAATGQCRRGPACMPNARRRGSRRAGGPCLSLLPTSEGFISTW